jgi:acyl-CoA synthetase (AMP-forming)/AMP-acid ligase II
MKGMGLHALPSLLAWLEAPASSRAIAFADSDGWDRVDYSVLAGRVARLAGGMKERGVGPGDVVNLVLPSGQAFVELFVATLLCGATASPVAPPAAFTDRAMYRERVDAIVRLADPKLVVCEAGDLAETSAAVGGQDDAGRPAVCVPGELPGTTAVVPGGPLGDLALLQYTSGTSGGPKAVMVGWEQLEANIESTIAWMNWDSSDVAVSWLPFHHDFGSVGALVTSLVLNCELRVMTPQQFVRTPLRWLECLGKGGGTVAATTSFGLAHLVRRAKPENLDGMNLTGVKQIAIGGDRIDASVLHRFLQLTMPYGLDAGALGTAYGLAEATLGVSGTPYGEQPKVLEVNWSDVAKGRPAPVIAEHDLRSPVSPPPTALVSCGPPVAGVDIEIRGPGGAVLAPGHVGEVVVRGPQVARGYRGSTDDGRFADGRLFTGDSGFLHDGRLVVIGRSGDSMKVLGRTVFAEELEQLVSTVSPLPATQTAVLVGTRAGTDTVVVLAETREAGPWTEEAVRCLRRAVGAAVAIEVVVGRRGMILRTTSGKLRRAAMWERFESATLGSGAAAGKPGRVETRAS